MFSAGFMPFHIKDVQFFSQEISVMVKWRTIEHCTANHISDIRHKILDSSVSSDLLISIRRKCFHCLPGMLCLQFCRLKPERALFFWMCVGGNPLLDVLRRQRLLTVKIKGNINISYKTYQRKKHFLQHMMFNSKDFPILKLLFVYHCQTPGSIGCRQIFKTEPPASIKIFWAYSIASVPSIFLFHFLCFNTPSLSQRVTNFYATYKSPVQTAASLDRDKWNL